MHKSKMYFIFLNSCFLIDKNQIHIGKDKKFYFTFSNKLHLFRQVMII